MSLLVSAIHRRDVDPELAKTKLIGILRELAPEPIRPTASCEVRQRGHHIQGTINVPGHYPRHGLSLCQGKLYDSSEQWWQPGSGVPDGSYAIVRDGPQCVRGGERSGGQPDALVLPRRRPLRGVEFRAGNHDVCRTLRVRPRGGAVDTLDRHAGPRRIVQPAPAPAATGQHRPPRPGYRGACGRDPRDPLRRSDAEPRRASRSAGMPPSKRPLQASTPKMLATASFRSPAAATAAPWPPTSPAIPMQNGEAS